MDISFSLCFSVFCYALTLHLESVKKKNPTATVFTNGTDKTCTTRVKVRDNGKDMSALYINFRCIFWNYKNLYF